LYEVSRGCASKSLHEEYLLFIQLELTAHMNYNLLRLSTATAHIACTSM